MSLKIIVAFQVSVSKNCKMNGFMATPAIAQLVEHVLVDACSNQIVPGSITGGRIFGRRLRGAAASVARTARLTHRHARCPQQHVQTLPNTTSVQRRPGGPPHLWLQLNGGLIPPAGPRDYGPLHLGRSVNIARTVCVTF